MKSLLIQKQPALILLLVILQVPLFVGCLPFSRLNSTTVTNLSGKSPYKEFVGKCIVTKEEFSVWIYPESSYGFLNYFIRIGFGGGSPSGKIADLPIGTRIEIYSIKHKRVTTEMGGYDGTQALCTVSLSDGRKIDCQLDWGFLNPDPRVWPTRKFELIKN